MGRWDISKVRNCFSCVMRGKSPTYVPESRIRVINQACVYWDGIRIDNVKYQNENNADKVVFLQPQDVLINSTGTGTLGRCNVFNIEDAFIYSIDSHVTLLRPYDHINSLFVRYYFMMDETQRELYKKCVNGSTNQIELSKNQLLEFPIPVPPLDVQQKIADVLNKASALIELRKAQLDKLDLLIKSQFIEMFGDPATNPKGWEIGAIRDLVRDVKYGTSKPAEADGVYVYLRMNNITYSGGIDLTDLKYINVDEKEYEKYVIRKGDLLFNRTNSKELVGKTAIFKENTPMIIAGYIIRVRTNEKANPEYISAFLNSRYGKELLYDMCKAIVGQANINAQELQNIKIPITPISLQNEFKAFVEKTEAQKSLLQKSLKKMRLNYKSLMQKCFRGEVF
ncbi:MAG: restriction endonuclease subunit S [Dehalobacter sp. 4CP]|uniref:restriction endonuclease subunit S n=1 Tax=Dehalobacter sp. CP TaxID=2594474 RepID=UPI0013C88066|nr:restriction endonuclease subunit S [Dehalobacter sp.]NBJ16926.1 restriction endonuclease subunit S [Dehalobacter sp. 4CP]